MSDFLLTKLIWMLMELGGQRKMPVDCERRIQDDWLLKRINHGGAKASVFKVQSVVVWIGCP